MSIVHVVCRKLQFLVIITDKMSDSITFVAYTVSFELN